MTPTAFIFLYENQLFLTFKHRTVAVWNFRVRASAALPAPCCVAALALELCVIWLPHMRCCPWTCVLHTNHTGHTRDF